MSTAFTHNNGTSYMCVREQNTALVYSFGDLTSLIKKQMIKLLISASQPNLKAHKGHKGSSPNCYAVCHSLH